MNQGRNLTEYVDTLYSAALRKTGDSHAVEDIVQETFLAAMNALARGKVPGNLRRWLLGILSNKYCDWLREKYNKPSVSFEDCGMELPDESHLDDDSAEKLEAIRCELGYLAKIHREVMVRFYMYGDTTEEIAGDLHIPIGTVKSRLNAGRRHIREGVTKMERYTKQSYNPDILRLSLSGKSGLNDEPFSLVGYDDILTQNVLIFAWPKPVTEIELAQLLGVPVAFIEPIVKKMIQGELMQRTDGGRVYTDFILYTEQDRKAIFQKQLDMAEKHFDLFWKETQRALCELEKREYYQRQTEHGKRKLALHFCIKLLMNAHIDVRNEVTGALPYSEYPHRKNGGRWFAMGQQYPPDYDFKKGAEFWKYDVSGEAANEIKNFRDAKYLALRKYDTELGRYPNCYFKAEYIRWLYELMEGVPREQSAVGDCVLEATGSFLESGILKKEGSLKLDIPMLTLSEYHDESALVGEYVPKLSGDIREVFLPVFYTGYVRLPPHLKSVPKWQQYMFCGNSVPMAVIHKAIEKELLFAKNDCPIPASILVVEKG